MSVDAERDPLLPSSTPTNVRLPWRRHTRRAFITVALASTLLWLAWRVTRESREPWPTQCSPKDFSDGKWQQKLLDVYPLKRYLSLYPYNASDPRKEPWTPSPDVARNPLAPLGFAGCASGRERTWHLGMQDNGTPDPNRPELWGHVVRGASYDWVPKSSTCRRYNEPVAADKFVRTLVERGGWFLVGDSITEQHFFSLSCLLYPHVRATPDFEPIGGTGPQDLPQDLYLNPTSPLVSQLSLPTGFNISHTPLVSFRRVDLLFDKPELDAIHRSIHDSSGDSKSDKVPDTMFGPDATESFNLSPRIYLPQFTASLPDGNFRTLIVSTGAHWTTDTLPGAREVGKVSAGSTNPAIYKTFVEAVKVWTEQVSEALKQSNTGQGLKSSEREVLIRAYTPGHEGDCHKEPGPLATVRPFSREWYNWSWIGRMNEVFRETIAKTGDSQIRYLSLDRMALLRPDTHSLSDCLHVRVGVGIFEGWSSYIWHFGEDRMSGMQ